MAYSEQYIAQLILKYFRDELSPVEMEQLEHWLSESPQNRIFFEGLDEEEDIIRLMEIEENDDKNATAQKLLIEIQNRIAEQDAVSGSTVIRPYSTRNNWWYAAAAITLITAAFFWMRQTTSEQTEEIFVSQTGNNVLPGSDRAILTLSNGQQVELREDGSQVINDGDLAISNNNGELVYAGSDQTVYNTMTTPRGGQYRITLADGSKVWLNAASSITFPTRFDSSIREVSVTGEVYFDVEEDKKKPFVVKTPAGRLEVLGTEFNVNSYEDETYETTTLIEGRVRLTKATEKIELKPGEQSRISEQSGKIAVAEVNVDDVIGWRDNLFVFNKADIPTIMRQLSRWYDLDIEYKGTLPTKPYNGKIPRELSLGKVLSALKLAGVHLEMYDKTLIISGVN